MKRWYLLGSWLLVACSGSTLPVLDRPLIEGLPEPVLMGLEASAVIMGDVIQDPTRVDSVSVDGPFEMEIDNSNVILYGRPEEAGYALTFWSEGVGESLLLKKDQRTLRSFVYQTDERIVYVTGTFNGWSKTATKLQKQGNVFSTYELLSPGYYEYRYIVQKEEVLDPYNPDSILSEDGKWSSFFTIPEPDPKKLALLKVDRYEDNMMVLRARNMYDKLYAFWENTLLPADYLEEKDGELLVTIPENAFRKDLSTMRFCTINKEGLSPFLAISLVNGQPTQTYSR